jgi:hypothetical protein
MVNCDFQGFSLNKISTALNEIRFEDQMGGEGIFSKTYLVG